MADNGPPSRFAFIMHADVVGSTAMVQHDERIAHERIQGAFRRLSQIIATYGGVVHEVRGDALVAEFDKASDAASAALTYQSEPAAPGDDGVQRPRLRIGIAMGEVIIADRTVTGAGAVLAQRLEQLAGSGEVVVQGAACESIPQRMPFRFEPLGEHEVKGFERPVRAFRVHVAEDAAVPKPARRGAAARFAPSRRHIVLGVGIAVAAALAGIGLSGWHPWHGEAEPASTDRMAHPLPDTPSLAFLPLAPARGGDNQAYLADGLTDQLLATLSTVDELFVVARDSSFAYRGTSIGTRQIAEELGVRYLVQGSVDRAADTLAVKLSVVDAVAAKTLVEENREQPWSRVLDLQERLVADVVEALGIELSQAQRERLLKHPTTDPAAFDFFLRGQALRFRLTAKDNARAREMYLRATDRDPGFARALAALAMTYLNDVRFDWNDAGAATLSQAREVAEQALNADQRLPQAHLAAGQAELLGGNARAALTAGERAVKLDPGLADAHVLLADALTITGDAGAAVARMQTALRINPFPAPNYEVVLGRALYFAGDAKNARVRLQRAVELDPNELTSRVLLSAALDELGEASQSKRQAQQVLALAPDFDVESWVSGSAFASAGRVDALKASLQRAGLPSGTLALPHNDTGRK